MPSSTRPLPCGILNPGAIVHEMTTTPTRGQTVYVHSRGRVREARVIRATATRVQVEYATPTGSPTVGQWRKLAHKLDRPIAPEGLALGLGLAPHSLARSWRVESNGGRYGHTFTPVDGTP